jgi:pilus assembly protein Flp/PilA
MGLNITSIKEHLMSIFNRFAKDESGATAIEYGLIAGLISVVIITVITSIGTKLNAKFNTISTSLG